MVGTVFFGSMAAFGFVSLLWTLLGWLLPREQGTFVVCLAQPDAALLRYRWLRSLGFLRCPFLIVTEEVPAAVTDRDVEICSREALLSRLEQEKERFHGTGNGDSAGRHQRRGISEL